MKILLLFIFCLFSFLPPQELLSNGASIPSQDSIPISSQDSTPLSQERTSMPSQEFLPDGTPMPAFLTDTSRVSLEGKRRYVLTRYGVCRDSTKVQTRRIQKVIDRAARSGGVVVVPKGVFMSGSLFFRPGTHLLLEEGAVLKGSPEIDDYVFGPSRMEGQSLDYFAALVNADGVDGFTICGPGAIDGNGKDFWQEFWDRRKANPKITNLEVHRPRLVFISNSSGVTVQDVILRNSGFWTNHLYKCDHVRYLGCTIVAPTENVKAPSSDAIDIDYCHDVLVDRCYMSVNDDGVVLKGGKGTWADTMAVNGPNYNVLVQNCRFRRTHGCLTLGSESLYNRNIIMRNCTVEDVQRVLWLKLRPDTPQHYEFVTVEGIRGTCRNFVVAKPWTQFYSRSERPDMPVSRCNDILLKDIDVVAKRRFSDVVESPDYIIENLNYLRCPE